MRKINWGVIGTAGIAKGQTIPGMKLAENCSLLAIAGRDMKKAQAYQKEFGFERAYGSYEELLADPDVEAVYIPLPNTLHFEWTRKALQAKKHVLCEKPLVPTAKEAEELFALADENGVILMEAFAYLHSPWIAAIRQELDSGVIGQVRYMESQFLTSDYDSSNIRMRRETCGGSVYDLGCYTVTMIAWMLGRQLPRLPDLSESDGRFYAVEPPFFDRFPVDAPSSPRASLHASQPQTGSAPAGARPCPTGLLLFRRAVRHSAFHNQLFRSDDRHDPDFFHPRRLAVSA